MSRIFITGDIHGSHTIDKLDEENILSYSLTHENFGPEEIRENDCIIVLGDFGIPWKMEPDREDLWCMATLEKLPCKVLFLDGNHENFDYLDTLPTTTWHGGRVQYVTDRIIHLMRGQVFEIAGHTFFTCGGARSVDRDLRTPHESWWSQEVPDDDEREAIAKAAAKVGRVDCVLTHAAPAQAFYGVLSEFDMRPDEYCIWLQDKIGNVLEFGRWLFGHYHIDRPRAVPYTPLYDEFVIIGE